MFERFQAYPKYTIDDRKGMHLVSTLICAMCEKQVRRRSTGRLSQQSLNRNSSQAVRVRFGTFFVKKNKTRGKTKKKSHGRLPARVPAYSVSRVSRRQQETGAEGAVPGQ